MDSSEILKECKELERYGRSRESIALLDEAILMSSADSELFYLRGSAHERLGEVSLAFNDYSSAIEIKQSAKYLLAKGSLLIDRSRHKKEALDCFLSAGRLKPTSPLVHQHLSFYYHVNDDFRKAREHAERALALDDQNGFSNFCIAKCDLAESQWASAAVQCRRAIELESSSLYWETLAKSYIGAKDIEHAIESYGEAIAIEPSPGLYIRLARLQIDLGNVDEALESLNFAQKFELGEANQILVEGYLAMAKRKGK